MPLIEHVIIFMMIVLIAVMIVIFMIMILIVLIDDVNGRMMIVIKIMIK